MKQEIRAKVILMVASKLDGFKSGKAKGREMASKILAKDPDDGRWIDVKFTSIKKGELHDKVRFSIITEADASLSTADTKHDLHSDLLNHLPFKVEGVAIVEMHEEFEVYARIGKN